ncbi:hypothetical protein H6F88_22500 [Oculatella sp. FACHB-28]|nr:hypothetical protein [Oculatella sp. FACHB-28]
MIQTCKTGSEEQVGAANHAGDEVARQSQRHSRLGGGSPKHSATTKALRRFHASRTVPSFSVGLAVHLKHGVAPTYSMLLQ